MLDLTRAKRSPRGRADHLHEHGAARWPPAPCAGVVLCDGAAVLIFSKPGAQKVRNLRHSPHAMLALDSADEGEDIAPLAGRAELLGTGAPQPTLPAYAAKYAALMARPGITPESMAAEYTQAIRVQPERLVRF